MNERMKTIEAFLHGCGPRCDSDASPTCNAILRPFCLTFIGEIRTCMNGHSQRADLEKAGGPRGERRHDILERGQGDSA